MISGIHHITAIASDAKVCVDFYTRILGLRLVKKTVNQDDTGTYHLFFGDRLGHPGMDLTFFIFKPSTQGIRGNGLVTTISLAVPDQSLDFWIDRFQKESVKHDGVTEYFGKKRIVFFDGDNQQLELVGVGNSEFDPYTDIWTTAEIKPKNAIRNFYSATLQVEQLDLVEPILLNVFGYQKTDSDDTTHFYTLSDAHRANRLIVSVLKDSDYGFNAAGTVHHIAFRAKDETHQLEFRERVTTLGIPATPVIDRFYFKSVYFRTPSGILFEIATDGPGFTADENESELGQKLALPPFLESERKIIESRLPILE